MSPVPLRAGAGIGGGGGGPPGASELGNGGGGGGPLGAPTPGMVVEVVEEDPMAHHYQALGVARSGIKCPGTGGGS